MLPAELRQEQLDNARCLAIYRARGYRVVSGPSVEAIFHGHLSRCAVLERGGERFVLQLTGDRSHGLLPHDMTDLP